MSLEDRLWTISQSPANADGFTRYTYGLNQPAQGYCVAYSDTQNFHGKAGLRKAIAHAQVHSQVIGGWLENGKFYFDSVRVYHTKQAAIEAAIRENQIAFFDLNGTVIKIKDDGGNLTHEYQSKLNEWNRKRERAGMQPFKILS